MTFHFFHIQVGCQSDSECKESHACRGGDCTPVCGPNGLPCGGNAECTGIGHKAICTCPVGLEGDPYVTCSTVECRADADCPPDRACINKRCEDPCSIENPCDDSSECKVTNHLADCTCPPGFRGSKGTACAKGKWLYPVNSRAQTVRITIDHTKSRFIG